MYYATNSYLFTTATPSINGFVVFTTTTSPRDTHLMFEDLHTAFHTSNGPCLRESKTSNVKSGLRRLFGGL